MKKVLSLIVIFVLGALNAQAQWEQCKGPYGGKINCVAASGTIVFAGTDDGIYRSTDDVMAIHGRYHGRRKLNM
jgi:hypothetical protein